MKRNFLWGLPVIILCCLLSGGALANHYDIKDYNGILTIPSGTHTITNETGITNNNLEILCSSPNTILTLNRVKIYMYSTGHYTHSNGKCPLTFTGDGNQLILSGTSTLDAGLKEPGIKVETGTTLTISGGGTLNATGGPICGSGIGSSYNNGCGTIIINNGIINARGGTGGTKFGVTIPGCGIGGGACYRPSTACSGGSVTINGGVINTYGDPGIGGGHSCDGFYVEINSGTVNGLPPFFDLATETQSENSYGTGIGGGTSCTGIGKVIINGGQVTARGGFNSPGIGAGYLQRIVPTINITNGVVSAYGGRGSAGIGSGYSSGAPAGNINISGGLVYACKGSGNSNMDIGSGEISPYGEITIANDAVVLLGNNAYKRIASNGLPDGHMNETPYSRFPMTFVNNTVFGVSVNPSWTTARGGFFRLPILAYQTNGGIGTAPASPTPSHMKTTAIVANGNGLSKTGYIFSGWNTRDNGSGTAYAPNDSITITADTILYAQWALPAPAPTAVPTMPQTGDTSHIILFSILALLSISGLCFASISRKNRKKDHC